MEKCESHASLILRCDRILPMEVSLPEGVAIREAQGEPGRALDAFLNGQPVGSIALCGGAERTLRALTVAEPFRRRGIGRALVKSALKLLRREDNAAPVWAGLEPEHGPAALLLCGEGFRIQREAVFGGHANGFEVAMGAMQAALAPELFAKLAEAVDEPAIIGDLSAIRYDAQGLVPAIAQDAFTGEVLMQAYMNAESLRLTIETGYATYWSRSRRELWRKGATSGHLQRVVSLHHDCDGDAILMQVEQTGPACHTGKRSCFHNPVLTGEAPATPAILTAIEQTVAHRAAHPRPGSYTNYLLDKGAEKICKKVGEEASETIIAAMKNDPDALAGEAADLLYHLIVLLHRQGVPMRDVWQVLKERHS